MHTKTVMTTEKITSSYSNVYMKITN